MVEQIREEIESLGGEFHFQRRVDDIVIEDGRVRGVVVERNGEAVTIESDIIAWGVVGSGGIATPSPMTCDGSTTP